MNTITLNTLTGAVSEYSGLPFEFITPTHAGHHSGLYSMGGATDAGVPIAAGVITGKSLHGTSLRKSVDTVFISVKGGASDLTVYGESASHTYRAEPANAGVTRVKPGRGIRENYLSFGLSNVDGGDFQLDRIEASIVPSTSRRT